jgi:hypothetical protein
MKMPTNDEPPLDRRSFLAAQAAAIAAVTPLASGTLAAVSLGSLAADAQAAPAADIPATGFPTPNLPGVREALEPVQMSSEFVCTEPQPVYALPRDHKFHAGGFYATNHFWEWHYWSGFAKDDQGNDYALFFGTDPVGYNPQTGGYAFLPAVVSISPIKEGKKYHYFNNFPSFEAKRPEDSTSPADFQYLLRNDEAGWSIDERYYANDERWVFRMKSKNPQDPWCDLDIRLAAPGYIPRTPTGIEEEGFNDDGRYNPQTMHGLSYYYIAPDMPFTGTLGFNGKQVQVTGSVWLEHQWGNIKGLDRRTVAGGGSRFALTMAARWPSGTGCCRRTMRRSMSAITTAWCTRAGASNTAFQIASFASPRCGRSPFRESMSSGIRKG